MQRFTQAGRPALHIRGGFCVLCAFRRTLAMLRKKRSRRVVSVCGKRTPAAPQINSITRLPEPVFCRGKPLFSFFIRPERHVYLNPK